MCPKDADETENRVDTDQTAPQGAVWFGSSLFAETHLSQNLGSLRYNGRDFYKNSPIPVL